MCDDGLVLPTWRQCARLTGHASGCWPGVQRVCNPGGMGALVASNDSSSLPARLSRGQSAGEEKECAAINQRLPRRMRAAGMVGARCAQRSLPFGPSAVPKAY